VITAAEPFLQALALREENAGRNDADFVEALFDSAEFYPT